jgi:hypothetical protein
VYEFGSQNAGQHQKENTTKTTYSPSVEPTPKSRKNVLPIMKDAAKQIICGFCLLNYYLRNRARKVTRFAGKNAKLGIKNCVLVLSGKTPLQVGNMFDRNCTSL